jgi:Protein of unknown function, DUF481
MNCRVVLYLIAILAVTPMQAREKSDVVIMKNGDKITCEIKGLSSNTLYISVQYILNTLSVDWTNVDHIDSKQLFLVKTQGGTTYTGMLSSPETPAGRPLEIEVVEAPGKAIKLSRTRVVSVNETSSSFWQRWNAELGSGFTYSRGNQSAQYNLNSSIGYVMERWSAGGNYTSNLSSSTGTATSTNNQLMLQAERLLRRNNWYYTGLISFLQSSVKGIQLENIFGGGIGRNIVNRGSVFLTAYGGLALQQINYEQIVQAAPTQQVTGGLLGMQLKTFQFDKTNLIVSANMFPAISDPGRMQFIINTSYYVKLWGQLNWNVTFYGNWDNRPPNGLAHTDYGTSSGLSLTFGNPLLH